HSRARRYHSAVKIMHCLRRRNVDPSRDSIGHLVALSLCDYSRLFKYFAQLLQDRAILFAEVQFANLSPGDNKRGTKFVMGSHQFRLRHLLHFIP
ncbi:MAG: hypothetical protein ACK5PR_01165, partial [bacterium]